MSLAEHCASGTFSSLTLLGAEILTLGTTLVTDYTVNSTALDRWTQPSVEAEGINFCNVTVSYTHPGQNDNIIVETWLPVGTWNERLQAVGGSGYTAGRVDLSYNNMNGAIADGYATVTTDAGVATEFSEWVLVSPGNLNLYNMQNFASVSLNDEVRLVDRELRFGGGKGGIEGVSGSNRMTGNHRKVPHEELLRKRSRLLLLERLLHGRPTGPPPRTAVPGRLRRHRSRRPGPLLQRIPLVNAMAPASHEHERISPRLRARRHRRCFRYRM